MKPETKDKLKKVGEKLSKFKFPALILLLGLVLILLPGQKESQEQTTEQTQPAAVDGETELEYCARMETEIAQILGRIEGAGQVQVMLTLKAGKTTQYQTDYDTTSNQSGSDLSGATEQKTVILSRGSAYDEAVVVRTDYPSFQGALIVAQGAGNAAVRLELVNAVSALLGLGTDKISVVKMK